MNNLRKLRIELWALFIIECINVNDFYFSQIGKKLGISPCHAFAIKRQLIRYELITEFSQSDVREKHYILTKKGKEIAMEMLKIKNYFAKFEDTKCLKS
jgi:DNA-binding MarR family transcriptional regulator